MTIQAIIVRGSTGTYHRSWTGANITACNASGQRRMVRIRPATQAEIERAAPSMFCKKCFPAGKPAAE